VSAFPVGADTPAHQRLTAQKAAGTPVDIADLAAGSGTNAAQELATMLQRRIVPLATIKTAGISKLPLIEMPAEPRGPLLAIILSGDGGWRDLDKTIGEKLRADGVSVVGWDCLSYFWSRKPPEQIAQDLGLVIDTFASRWGASKIALIGYSFGADILPFAYDRLSAEPKTHVVQLSLLGFATAADFEIRVVGLVGAGPGKDALPTEPALALIDPSMIQCFYGANEDDSACPSLLRRAEVIRTAGGHHFDRNYGALAQHILDGFHRRAGL
jgi:type IV secretory pathway VirJ component